MRLVVQPGGTLLVTAPERISASVIEQFLAKNSQWINEAKVRMQGKVALPVRGRRDYLAHKEAARRFIVPLVENWSRAYGLEFNRIAIKDTTSLWGSCSRRGNLNFSFKLLFLPRDVAEYVIVHEVCHLAQPNHGEQFWQLVESRLSAYRRLRTELRRYVLH